MDSELWMELIPVVLFNNWCHLKVHLENINHLATYFYAMKYDLVLVNASLIVVVKPLIKLDPL